MVKPRLGFYLTEKTPKEPPITEKHKGWIVVYDIDEFLSLSSDEELYRYVQEQIEHLNLNWDVKELAVAITFHIIFREYPRRKNIPERTVAQKLAEFLNKESEIIQKLKERDYDA